MRRFFVDQNDPFCYNVVIVINKEQHMIELQCVSVAGGWQSAIKNTQVRFGPVYNRIQDLWVWQRNNIFDAQKMVD